MQSYFEFLVSVINDYHYRLHLFSDSFEWFCLQISSNAKYLFLSCPRHFDQGLIIATSHLIAPMDHHTLQHIQVHFGVDFQANFEDVI